MAPLPRMGADRANIPSASVHSPSSAQNISGRRQAPTINAPTSQSGKGGGGQRSIGDTFQVNPSNGTMSLSLPVRSSAGRSGFAPTLQLNYDSGSGNGPFGIGWQLSTQAISRRTAKRIPLYNDNDVFMLFNTEELVAINSNGQTNKPVVTGWLVQRYKPRIETSQMRIERWISHFDPNDVYWKTISDENVTTIFGRTDESRVFTYDEAGRKQIFSWLVCLAYDMFGNAIEYSYKAEDSTGVEEQTPDRHVCEKNRTNEVRSRQRYLKTIRYGNCTTNRNLDDWNVVPYKGNWLFNLILDYGEHDQLQPSMKEDRPWKLRTDPFSTYTSGFEIRTYRICRRLLMFHIFPQELNRDECLVSSTELSYAESKTATLLETYTVCGHVPKGLSGYTTERDPPYRFQYSHLTPSSKLELLAADVSTVPGLPGNLPVGGSLQVDWLDLDGEGAPGLLQRVEGGGWTFFRNENALDSDVSTAKFRSKRHLETQPWSGVSGSTYFEDLDGNGNIDMVCLDKSGKLSGYFERSERDWKAYSTFPSSPSINVHDDFVQRIDLTGNGLPDLLLDNPERDEMIWCESLGKAGYGSEQRTKRHNGVRLLIGDNRAAVYLADMSGDGLTDIVRVSNGRISYWPNMGHARFGKEIVMNDSPLMDNNDDFTQARVRLADVDGSGTTDLLYLPKSGGVKIHYNLAGNGWSEGEMVTDFPRVDNLSSVFVLDLLGKGTSCLCWIGSEPNNNSTKSVLHYIDLDGGRKPYLLTNYENGFGMSTSVSYRPSTWFFHRDERQGIPWTTKLPFPVQCVYELKTVDKVSSKSSQTCFAYHNGFFDSVEREFRGFGFVEQWSNESFYQDNASGFETPTTRTKTWYYTGDSLFPVRPESAFPAQQIGPSILPHKMETHERREALRALKGIQVRQEVYCEDNSERASSPFSILQSNHHVSIIQKPSKSSTGVFKVQPVETLTALFERRCDDPRIEHEIILESNEYGSVTKSVNIVYGKSRSTLSNPISKAQQERTAIEFLDSSFTNAIDDPEDPYNFRKPLSACTQRFRVYGLKTTGLFTTDLLRKLNLYSLPESFGAYDDGEAETNAVARKVLLEENRVYYKSSDLSVRLKLGLVETFSVVEQSYALAFTNECLKTAYGDSALIRGRSSVDLMELGGYANLDEDGKWWVPSGKHLFDLDPASELSKARATFYTPTVVEDAFGNATTIKMDSYFLLPVESTDALDNTLAVKKNNYLSMQASEIIDANGNCRQLAFNAFGEITGIAQMGKPEDTEGDSLVEFDPTLDEERIIKFFREPCEEQAKELLGSASQRFLYDRRAYFRSGECPAVRAEISRTEHIQGAYPDCQITVKLSYFNGLHQVVQESQLASREQNNLWHISGQGVSNSKNLPVRIFRPYFTPSHGFDAHFEKLAIAKTLFYDPSDRLIGTCNANHTWSKTRLEPWRTSEYDVGDTVLLDASTDIDIGSHFKLVDSKSYLPTWYSDRKPAFLNGSADGNSAQKSEIYHNTPVETHLDAFGKPILQITESDQGRLSRRYSYNAAGNRSLDIDSLDRIVEKTLYDLRGRKMHQAGMDYGERWDFLDCEGKPILSWNSRNICSRVAYDKLRRESEVWITLGKKPEVLVTRTTYGETEENAQVRNLRGKVFEISDQSGVSRNLEFDFQGNCIRSSKQFASDYKTIIDWQRPVNLEQQLYNTSTRFDALNRVVKSTDALGCVTEKAYNLTGQLYSVNWHNPTENRQTTFIQSSAYAAHGKPTKIEYGNQTVTTFKYDELTDDLLSRQTIRQAKKPTIVEDIHYSYDCAGRVVLEVDLAKPDEYFRNTKISAARDFTYDSLGRLVQATGREQVDASHGGGSSFLPYAAASAFSKQRSIGNGKQIFGYMESYKYDAVGNISTLRHEAASGAPIAGWTRKYVYEEPSLFEPSKSNNRLSRTETGSIVEGYSYDGEAGRNGCMTTIPGYSSLTWDCLDRLRSSSTQRAKDGEPETTWYVYDSKGVRVRKVTESASILGSAEPKKMKDTLYLQDLEICEKLMGDGKITDSKRYNCRVMGTKCIAIVEQDAMPLAGNSNGPVFRYQTSEGLELDDKGEVISHEEYSPFGATTHFACKSEIKAPRRYRFAAYERDVETGLDFVGARYYASWLGRWISPDPLTIIDGLNLYAYVGNDPLNKIDPSGTCGVAKSKKSNYGSVWVEKAYPKANFHPQVKEDLVNLANKMGKKGIHKNDYKKSVGERFFNIMERAMGGGSYRHREFEEARNLDLQRQTVMEAFKQEHGFEFRMHVLWYSRQEHLVPIRDDGSGSRGVLTMAKALAPVDWNSMNNVQNTFSYLDEDKKPRAPPFGGAAPPLRQSNSVPGSPEDRSLPEAPEDGSVSEDPSTPRFGGGEQRARPQDNGAILEGIESNADAASCSLLKNLVSWLS